MEAGDVSEAWLVWSRAAESALVDAYCFSGGPDPFHGLVLGRGIARFRHVRLGGCKVRKVRRDAVDVHDAADVFLYRDASIAPLLDMRRRIRAVMDVLGAMIRDGVSLARSVELTCQWGRILAIGPLHPVTFGDFHMVQGVGIGEFHRIVSVFFVVSVILFMQLLFIVVKMKRNAFLENRHLWKVKAKMKRKKKHLKKKRTKNQNERNAFLSI